MAPGYCTRDGLSSPNPKCSHVIIFNSFMNVNKEKYQQRKPGGYLFVFFMFSKMENSIAGSCVPGAPVDSH